MAIITTFWLYDLLLVIAVILLMIFIIFSRKYQYWAKRNIPTPWPARFPRGHFAGVSSKKPMSIILAELYKAAKHERFFGCYLMTNPIFVIRDLDLLKTVLVKDFSSFHDRGHSMDAERDPLAGHLFSMNGREWRNLRVKLTPTFTSGKMKMMFSTLVDVGKELEAIFEKAVNEPETEIKDIISRYTTDVISSCAFGVESNSLKDPDVTFRKMGLAITKPSLGRVIYHLAFMAVPRLAQYLPIKFFPDYLTKFFIGLVQDTMQYRADNQLQRNDFLQLLMQLKDVGYVTDADELTNHADLDHTQKFTVEQAAAQAFIFFIAGFETSSATMQFALYELSLNPDLQRDVQKEIDDVIAANGGMITYDVIQKMELLDRVVAETLRKYPIGAFLMRECTEEYTVPDTQVILQKGTKVWVSVYGIHHDPEYYPNPSKFDPNRFLPENKKQRHQYAYIPFGEGPRNCIGSRFALMQIKTGLAIIFFKFFVAPSKSTPMPLVFDPKVNVLLPKGDLFLKITQRQK